MDQNLSADAPQQESINPSFSITATLQSINSILNSATAQQKTIEAILTVISSQQKSIDEILTAGLTTQQRSIDASSSTAAQQGSIDACLSVAREGNIDGLYSLIQNDPNVLEKYNSIPFVETPLHAAVAAGHTKFALEIMGLKPSLARKLNKEGQTAVNLALESSQYLVALKLLEVHKELLRVQGKEGVTPLHYAAKIGNENLLAQFLCKDPESIVDLTFQNESALHIALKNNNFDAFRFLLNWLKRACFKNASSWERTLLNLKDVEGNTLLHIAASKKLYEVVGWLLDCGVKRSPKDGNGHTAFDILKGQHYRQDLLRRAKPRNRTPDSLLGRLEDCVKFAFQIDQKLYIFIRRGGKQISGGSREALLVVVTLLITVILQATLSPPGGTWQEDYYSSAANSSSSTGKLLHAAGTAIMDTSVFVILTAVNATYLLYLIFILAILLPSGRISTMVLEPLLMVASVTYIASVSVTFPGLKSTRLRNIFVSALFLVFSFFVFLAFYVLARQRRIDRKFLPKEPLEDEGKHDQELHPQDETA